MNRILFATILLFVASIGSAQNLLTPTGLECTGYGPASWYVAGNGMLRCYVERIDPAASTNPTDCQASCGSLYYVDSVFGYFRNNTYDSCVCLDNNNAGELDPTDTDVLRQGLAVESGQIPNQYVRDLAASTTFDIQADLNMYNSTQITIATNQTAVIRTSTKFNGNLITFVAKPSVTGLPMYSTFGFTVRNLNDFGSSIKSAKFRNNSFEIANLVQIYDPAVQYNKRQSSSSDVFIYTMKNLGDKLFVVLSTGTEPLSSWYYEPVASYVDNTILTLANDFTFNLEFESSATMQYASCFNTQCNNNTLEVCQNQTLVARKYCPIGCDTSANECLQCNSTSCQGTCSSDSMCVCSDTQLGNSCDVDLSTSSFTVGGGRGSRQGDFNIPAIFNLNECTVGEVCGTVSYIVPDMNVIILTLTGSCCTATLRLKEIQVVAPDTRTLQFVKESDWACKQGQALKLDTNAFDSTYSLTVRRQGNGGPYNSYTNWQWDGDSLNSADGSQVKCDASSEPSSNDIILNAVIPVSVTFMVVSCVAVAGGFVGGFFKSPRGLTVKKRGFKGCLPKSNAVLSRSIIAIVCVDVGVVTIMNLVGALYPISAMVLVSGILLAIMVFQFEAVRSRFNNNKLRALYHLQKVQRHFGRLGAAFLIIVGIFLLASEMLGQIDGGVLGSIIINLFKSIVVYFYLALFITWIFVAVHFAAAIYISVVYYYTAARTDEQDSIKDSGMEEMDEQPENETEP